jgi:hypothetical protein
LEMATSQYNNSLVYNLAMGGATIDRTIVAPEDVNIPTFKEQVQDRFQSHYSMVGQRFWRPGNSVFMVFLWDQPHSPFV